MFVGGATGESFPNTPKVRASPVRSSHDLLMNSRPALVKIKIGALASVMGSRQNAVVCDFGTRHVLWFATAKNVSCDLQCPKMSRVVSCCGSNHCIINEYRLSRFAATGES